MKPATSKKAEPWRFWLLLAAALILLTAILPRVPIKKEPTARPPTSEIAKTDSYIAQVQAARARRTHAKPTAKEIVAAKLNKFSVKRRALVHSLAQRYQVEVLPDVEKLFDALEAGDFAEAKRLFQSLRQDMDGPPGPDMRKYFRAALEAYGAAEQVNLWPAQRLLDYGNGVLDSLKPGMVYVGGTDPGCFIPTMLNETTDGEQHITLTQNALADTSYLQYLTAIYGDSLGVPTAEDATKAFDQYVADATQRQQHDEQFPDEPKQFLPGENITTDANGHTSPNGQVSIMAINNILMQNLLAANPDLSFGMEESFPLSSSYAGAVPQGPTFELRADDPMTADDASQAVNYWQNQAQNLQNSGETSDAVLRSYAHDANTEGNLLAYNNFPAAAGQAYQTALDICPWNIEAITALTRLLAQQGQFDQAGQALDTFLQNNPQQSQVVSGLRQASLARP